MAVDSSSPDSVTLQFGREQLLQYVRRLNDIAINCDVGSVHPINGDASDLRRIADQLAASLQPATPTGGDVRNDLGIVLAALRYHEESTGEKFDDDGGVVAQIERDHSAGAAQPSAGTEDASDALVLAAHIDLRRSITSEGRAAIMLSTDQWCKIVAALRAREAAQGSLDALRSAFPHFQDDAPVTPEVIAEIGRDWSNMVMNWAPAPREIKFCDQDGTERTLEWEVFEDSAGWVIPETADWQASPHPSTEGK